MLLRKTILTAVCHLFFFFFVLAQTTSYNFHRLTTAEGLNDGTIRGVAQDKYGYIWIGTITSLNRYNGYSVKTFNYSEKESSHFPYGALYSLYSDKNGNLWVGMNTGLYKYNFKSNYFELQQGSDCNRILDFAELNKDTLFIATNQGLAIYLQRSDEFKLCADNKKIFNVWITFGFNNARLLRTNISFSEFEVYDKFYYSSNAINDNTIPDLFSDNKGRLWLCTSSSGVALYDPEKDDFRSFGYDAQQPMSIVANTLSVIYEDRNGFIWVGSEGYGVSYFHPDNCFIMHFII